MKKIIVWNIDNDCLEEFDDTAKGRDDALNFCAKLFNEGWDFPAVFIGERMNYNPPSENGSFTLAK